MQCICDVPWNGSFIRITGTALLYVHVIFSITCTLCIIHYVEFICWEYTKMLLAGDVYPDIGGTSSMDTFLVLRIGHIPHWVNAERNIIVQNDIANIWKNIELEDFCDCCQNQEACNWPVFAMGSQISTIINNGD